MEASQITAVEWFPFDCLPRESQRVISFPQPEGLGAQDTMRNAIEHRSNGADVAHLQHVATRMVASQLLAAQGATDTSVLTGSDRAPRWPRGFIGSVTHTTRFAAAAVLPQSTARSVGIDAERELSADQQALVRRYCLVNDELDALHRAASTLSETQALTLCFSAKEAVFKCLYPLVKHYFDFTCVRIVANDKRENFLSIKVLDAEIAQCVGKTELIGSYRLAEGHVFTAIRLDRC